MSAELPLKIGKYDVAGLIGRGARGTLYEAVDPDNGRRVAIEMIAGAFLHEMASRFSGELGSTGRQHLDKLNIYDLGIDEGNPYVVIEYLQDEGLADADLDRVLGQLERELISREIEEVASLLDRGELFEAQRFLLRVLTADPQHGDAIRLLGEVQRRIQEHEISEPMFGLWVQAEKALAGGQFEEARHHAEHALALNPDDTDLRELRETLHAEAERTERLQRLLDIAQVAQAEGNLDAAMSAVEEAREVSPANAEAKALHQLISRAILERARQRQIESHLKDARQELSSGKFDLAIEILRRAEELDPNAPGVQSLIQLAVSGRQQEHRQVEIEALSDDIQKELTREDYRAAIRRSDEGLVRYPQQRTLIYLKAQAEVQLQLAESKRVIDAELAAARELFQAGRTQEVRERLERVLMLLGSEPLLISPLSIPSFQSDHQRKGQDSEAPNLLQDAANGQSHDSDSEILHDPVKNLARHSEVAESPGGQRSEETEVVQTALHMVEQEPELGQSRIILQTALLKLPNDKQLREKLTQIDRLQAIVSRTVDEAKTLEEAGRYDFALAKWEMVQILYSRHPDLKNALVRIRNLQQGVRGNSRQTWIDRIEQALRKSDYNEALAMVEESFQEFAWDSELMELRERAEFAIRQRAKAERLLEKAQILVSKQRWKAGGKTFLRAYQAGPEDVFIRKQVVEGLSRASRDAMSMDREAAEAILQDLEQVEVPGNMRAAEPEPQEEPNAHIGAKVTLASGAPIRASVTEQVGDSGPPPLIGQESVVPSDVSIDNLRFTVTAPGTILCGEASEIQVWVHPERELESLLERAREGQPGSDFDGGRPPEAVRMRRGACLSIRLKVSGVTCAESHQYVRWAGEIGQASFALAVPSNVREGDLVGLASVRLNGCQIGKLSFLLNVGAKALAIRALPCKTVLHRKAFASYESVDRDEVLACVQEMEAAYKGLKVYVDAPADRSVTYWEPGLHGRIDGADVFYLFWCRHSMVSDWVGREWRWALRSKGMDFIDMVPLESLENAPLPAELAGKDCADLYSGTERQHA